MVDINIINLIVGPILAPIVLTTIAAVALWSYMKVHDKRLLIFCVAFSIWAAGYIIGSTVGLFYNSIVDSSSLGIPLLNVIIQATILLAIAILAYVYYSDRRAHGMRFTRPQWVVGALVVFVELAIVALNIASIFEGLRNINFLAMAYPNNLFLWVSIISYIIAGTTYALTTYIVISLYSSYKIAENNNTLIVMTGFAFLLSSDLLGLIYYHFGSLINLSIGRLNESYIVGMVSQILTLVGFVVLLVALLRLKVFR